jgi:hypothetical protein
MATVLAVSMSRIFRIAFLYGCWLAMMAVHEWGHVLHAWLSGGQVERVILPWFGFSRTDLAHNPHPLFVAWGGALWGTLLPLGLLALARAVRSRFVAWIQFFAGFCLIANGAYLAAGAFVPAGDAADVIDFGLPRWTLVASGVPGIVGGLYLWDRLGVREAGRSQAAATDQGPAGRSE